MSNTRRRLGAQAPTTPEPITFSSHREIAQRYHRRRWRIVRPRVSAPPRPDPKLKFQIQIEKAVRAILMTACNTRAACRSVGLHSERAEREVRRVCDQRGIPRRHWWGTELRVPAVLESYSALVKPHERTFNNQASGS